MFLRFGNPPPLPPLLAFWGLTPPQKSPPFLFWASPVLFSPKLAWNWIGRGGRRGGEGVKKRRRNNSNRGRKGRCSGHEIQRMRPNCVNIISLPFLAQFVHKCFRDIEWQFMSKQCYPWELFKAMGGFEISRSRCEERMYMNIIFWTCQKREQKSRILRLLMHILEMFWPKKWKSSFRICCFDNYTPDGASIENGQKALYTANYFWAVWISDLKFPLELL